MNKLALKNLATRARRELLQRVEARALKMGITAEALNTAEIESSDALFINGKQLSNEEKIQRDKLIERVKQIGFYQVIDEVAYTWFNRFTALRFMEINDYLPTKVRVLSSSYSDSTEPDMMKEVLSLNLELDKEYVYELKMKNDSEELFKYLIIKHCNDLNRYMPFMFEKINDYSEILFPEGLLATDSFIRDMTNTELIPEENWEKIEVIGWLYQFYITDEKDRVFREKKKYKAEEIPFATQLFTPEWIVHYMVQNSLGRYWVEAHPEHRDLQSGWDYYLEHEQEDFEEKIIPFVCKDLNVEDIKCFDPAMGSGHILVYMFDVLYEIYKKCGYMEREIPRLIIEKNLYGLDIDDRAYQLACFSVVMKALKYNRRFLRSIERDGLTLNLASIQETNGWTDDDILYLVGENSGENYDIIERFVRQYVDAKTFGSLIKVTEENIDFLKERFNEIKSRPIEDLFNIEKRERVLSLLPNLISQTKIMGQTYDVVILNPPYMGSGSMNKELASFLKQYYPDSKSDLFAAFMEIDQYLKLYGFYAAVNQHSWMFLSSYEKLRGKIIKNKFIDTMLHLGPRAFEEIGGEVVQTTAFVMRNLQITECNGTYLRMVEENTAEEKRKRAIEAVQNPTIPYRYSSNQTDFTKIPGCSLAYWASHQIISLFDEHKTISGIANPRLGMATANNNRFLRLWHEVNWNNTNIRAANRESAQASKCRWFPYNKGGEYRKWYGNIDYIVDWENDGEKIRSFVDDKGKVRSHNYNLDYIFKPSITWSALSSGSFGSRFSPKGFLFDNSGSSLFTNELDELYIILGYLSTNIVRYIFPLINPTLNYQPGTVGSLPFLSIEEEKRNEIIQIVKENIIISKNEWDAYEVSWDFKKHPLLYNQFKTIDSTFREWEQFTENQFNQLKSNEVKLNDIFIELFSLQNAISREVQDKDITIRKADLEQDIKSFISYAIGCSFGRYSLDDDGLIFAGGKINFSRYKTFPVDEDNILPISPYFDDDIVIKFIDFIGITFGREQLNENLKFIANALDRKKDETARETLRRYFLNDFYKDHVRVYKKHPIYWLFTSGKEKAFNCLIYMHRYDKSTLSRIRTDYLHECQIRLDAEKKDLLHFIESGSRPKEISNANKELKLVNKKIAELKDYDELLHYMADKQIEIDLDDGVKVNYEKFKGLVQKI
ncbi:BREX-1 system adenine-specific DNA-methyltransferase PglX [Bacillus niameyensis]|uniref:BREX-1 system adenine-specific DNA-methyltransferase PglX n=1 Tax=Bacillus niameyensis TaxID=1522308 RepID=UPI000784C837|nr:BREX-1 system adenine-specific DNA-methyltransferase PglX [Bacillus niameyensis]